MGVSELTPILPTRTEITLDLLKFVGGVPTWYNSIMKSLDALLDFITLYSQRA